MRQLHGQGENADALLGEISDGLSPKLNNKRWTMPAPDRSKYVSNMSFSNLNVMTANLNVSPDRIRSAGANAPLPLRVDQAGAVSAAAAATSAHGHASLVRCVCGKVEPQDLLAQVLENAIICSVCFLRLHAGCVGVDPGSSRASSFVCPYCADSGSMAIGSGTALHDSHTAMPFGGSELFSSVGS